MPQPADHLHPFRSPLAQAELRDALSDAGPWQWELRDSIYYGAYLRAWHDRPGKLRIYGDGPTYLLDLGDDPHRDTKKVLEKFCKKQLRRAGRADDDPAGLELLPFPAAPLDLYDDQPPRAAAEPAEPWTSLAQIMSASDPSLTLVARQVGTPSTFYSENPRQPEGHHFDILGAGTTDIEIDLHSPELVARMMAHEPRASADQRIIRSGKWAFFTNGGPGGFYAALPALATFASHAGAALGRDLEFRLRIDASPISDLPPPNQGGPIELFRIA